MKPNRPQAASFNEPNSTKNEKKEEGQAEVVGIVNADELNSWEKDEKDDPVEVVSAPRGKIMGDL